MMILAIDPKSAVPPFEQLRQQILSAISTGQLVAGNRLPPVRKLADELGIAPNTVARTFRELEQAGVVETKGRHGTFVRGADEVSRAAVALTNKYVAELRQLGIGNTEATRLLAAALKQP